MSAVIAQDGECNSVAQEAQEADPKQRHQDAGYEEHTSRPETPSRMSTRPALCPVSGHLFRFSTHVDDSCQAAHGGRRSHAGIVVRCWAAVRCLNAKTPPSAETWQGRDGGLTGMDAPPSLEGRSACGKHTNNPVPAFAVPPAKLTPSLCPISPKPQRSPYTADLGSGQATYSPEANASVWTWQASSTASGTLGHVAGRQRCGIRGLLGRPHLAVAGHCLPMEHPQAARSSSRSSPLLNPNQPRAGRRRLSCPKVDRLFSVRGLGSAKARRRNTPPFRQSHLHLSLDENLFDSQQKQTCHSFRGRGVKSCQAEMNNDLIARRRIWNGAGLFRSWEA